MSPKNSNVPCSVCGGRTDRDCRAPAGICGMCFPCYYKEWSAKNKEHVQSYKRDWYARWRDSGGRVLQKQRREQRYFDSKREAVLERDGHRCTVCHRKAAQLIVHHKDGHGRGHQQPNNSLDNLATYCRACHARIHSATDRWARHYDACTRCGRTDRKHNGHGLCVACYSLLGYHGEINPEMASYKRRLARAAKVWCAPTNCPKCGRLCRLNQKTRQARCTTCKLIVPAKLR